MRFAATGEANEFEHGCAGTSLCAHLCPFTSRIEDLKIAARQLLAPLGCLLVDAEREAGIVVSHLFL